MKSISYVASLGLSILLSATGAWAQQYPAKPVRVIVGFTAGGATDIVGRIVAQQFTERMGRPFVVENRAGATGMIGAEMVAKAPPDGHTLYIASQTTHAVAPYLYAKPLYDPITKLGLEIVGSAPDQYAAFLRAENVKWGNMVRQLKLKAD